MGHTDDSTLGCALETFRRLDTDGSGYLDRNEFKEVLKVMAMQDWTTKVDPASGRRYYVNTKTRESKWQQPDDDASVNVWLKEQLGEASGGGPSGGDGCGGGGSLGDHRQGQTRRPRASTTGPGPALQRARPRASTTGSSEFFNPLATNTQSFETEETEETTEIEV